MKTVFKVGMEVYDQVNNPNKKGKVLDIKEDAFSHKIHSYDYPIEVQFEGKDDLSYYDLEGCPVWSSNPTLSTSPYTLQGFEQKAPIRTYEEAIDWLEKNSKDRVIYADEAYINEEYERAFEALKKLTILRDYYNEGWQPNWEDDEWKYFIENYRGKLDTERTCGNGRVLAFKTKEIRDKFLEEQRELLEIAKPLL
ncbi:hypothetical protein [uncultured Capnocytophaga sp.]|uniref:hypothetical protein n=1 Tax=uncultured Capnocytophaga sp. TaxID=159273 RepID=UPI002622F1B0|nr:hypothetical protein [uncultured Capnocytophaga sp.]